MPLGFYVSKLKTFGLGIVILRRPGNNMGWIQNQHGGRRESDKYNGKGRKDRKDELM